MCHCVSVCVSARVSLCVSLCMYVTVCVCVCVCVCHCECHCICTSLCNFHRRDVTCICSQSYQNHKILHVHACGLQLDVYVHTCKQTEVITKISKLFACVYINVKATVYMHMYMQRYFIFLSIPIFSHCSPDIKMTANSCSSSSSCCSASHRVSSPDTSPSSLYTASTSSPGLKAATGGCFITCTVVI